VTGIATAMMDSSPIVCITGQVGSKLIGSDAFQETDITGITLPITKHNYLVTDANELAHVMREAFAIARSGRPGPVLVDICKDAQQQKVDFEWPEDVRVPGLHKPAPPDERDLARAIELIAKAERPLILAGAGVIRSGSSQLLQELAEKAGIPVALTLLGIGGFPQSHPLCLGMMGMHGEAYVNTAIQQADLILAFGMRFDDRVTGNLKTYAPNAKKIHIEIDASEVGKNVPVDVGIVGDLRHVLTALVPEVTPKRHDAWFRQIDEWRADTKSRDILHQDDHGKLYAAHVIHDLWDTTQGNAIVVTDVKELEKFFQKSVTAAKEGAMRLAKEMLGDKRWADFEDEHPRLFDGMYVFWCVKA
jgi:acetolactate synthase-1/2/3 large subunit